MNRSQSGDQLTDADLDWFEEILANRVNEDKYTDDKDEGIINISELDGFLTAIVSGP